MGDSRSVITNKRKLCVFLDFFIPCIFFSFFLFLLYKTQYSFDDFCSFPTVCSFEVFLSNLFILRGLEELQLPETNVCDLVMCFT